MRIAILGSGGVGGYFGARLAAAGGPDIEVTFIARGAHLEAMRSRGLRLLSHAGDLNLPTVKATDDPAAVGPVDIVFFTVKLYDAAAAVSQLPPLIGPNTIVVSFQNGVDSVDLLTRAIGREHVAGGTTYISAVVEEPGLIRHTAMGRLIFGILNDQSNHLSALEALRDAGKRAGFDAVLSDNITVDIWAKFARLTVLSGMTAVARVPIGVIVSDPGLLAMAESALHESIAVARGRQIPLPAKIFDDIMAGQRALPPGVKSSMLEDLERGRRLELPWLSGAVVRIGEEVGVATPTHRQIVTLLRPHVNGRPE